MRCHGYASLIGLVVFLTTLVRGQSSSAGLSQCAASCLSHTVPESGCSIIDTTCQCTSQQLVQLSAICMLANCTTSEALGLSKFQAALCKFPNESRSNSVLVANIVTMTLATICVTTRLFSKYWVARSFRAEDWIIAATLLLLVAPFVLTIISIMDGFGKHLYELEDGQLLSILRLFYFTENIYVVVLGCVKISLVVFYLHIFPQRSFKIAAYTVLVFIAVVTVLMSLLTILPCQPVAYFWNKDIKDGQCLDLNALGYVGASLNIFQDLVIICLPIPVVIKLKLGRKGKIGVCFMFAVGSFGCITSMIRLKSLLVFGNSADPTWDYVTPFIWTTIELAAVLICACLPAIRSLVAHLVPQLNTTRNQSYDGTKNLTLSSRNMANGYHRHAGLDNEVNENVSTGHELPTLQKHPQMVFESSDGRAIP